MIEKESVSFSVCINDLSEAVERSGARRILARGN